MDHALNASDLKGIINCLQEIHAGAEASDLPALMLRAISKLVPATLSAFTEVDPVLGKSSGCVYPPEPWTVDWIAPRFHANIADHPVVAYSQRTRDGQAMAISDFFTAKQLHATGLYREVFQPMKIEDQLSIGMVGSAGLMIGLSFNRARRGFSDRDRQILNTLRPHLLQAYSTNRKLQNLRDADGIRRGTVVDRLPVGLICVDRNGAVIWSTAPVQKILTDYFADAADSIHGLPDAIRWWLKQSGNKKAAAVEHHLMTASRPGFTLQIRSSPLKNGHSVLLLQENPSPESSAKFDAHSLTPREQQVMKCIVAGRSPVQASKELKISPRTLEKHLERVFDKLGVNTLAGACVKLLGPR